VKRLVAGGLLLVIAAAVGGAIGGLIGHFGYLAYPSLREPGSVERAGAYFIVFTTAPYLKASIWCGTAFGVLGGIVLGTWLLRRLLTPRGAGAAPSGGAIAR
jgi:hypothetical protein